jgi:hypothetical protein
VSERGRPGSARGTFQTVSTRASQLPAGARWRKHSQTRPSSPSSTALQTNRATSLAPRWAKSHRQGHSQRYLPVATGAIAAGVQLACVAGDGGGACP